MEDHRAAPVWAGQVLSLSLIILIAHLKIDGQNPSIPLCGLFCYRDPGFLRNYARRSLADLEN